MKKSLLFLMLFTGFLQSFAQSPVIEGDVMLCPYTNGTATVTTGTYDTYQWYSKYWFTTDEYLPIAGATAASFTYDWYTYDQSLFKVVVTLGTETFESNSIQIDSYAWTGLTVLSEMNEFVSTNMNNGNFMLCPGGNFSNILSNPYNANIQWYKDGVAIAGANEQLYIITEPGTYYVEGAPDFCPNSMSQGIPLVVENNSECTLGTSPNPLEKGVKVFPNPVSTQLQIHIPADVVVQNYRIIDATGKVMASKKVNFSGNATLDVSILANGFYFLVLESDSGTALQKFIKE